MVWKPFILNDDICSVDDDATFAECYCVSLTGRVQYFKLP